MKDAIVKAKLIEKGGSSQEALLLTHSKRYKTDGSILPGSHARKHAKVLKDETDPFPSNATEFLFPETGYVFIFIIYVPRGRAVEATKEIEQSAFA
jgi:hypothetical protein